MQTENNSVSLKETISTYTQFVFPSNLNPLNTLYGGSILSWMDITAAITAQRHAKMQFTTACVYDVNFIRPVSMGQIITIQGMITHVFNTSLEVEVQIYPSDYEDEYKPDEIIATAHFCMVALFPEDHDRVIKPVVPIDEHEKQTYRDAEVRKAMHLYKSGKLALDQDKLLSLLEIN